MGLGDHRRALCAGAVLPASGDPAVAAIPPLHEPFSQPPELDLLADAAAVRLLGPDLGQHRFLTHRFGADAVGHLRSAARRHAVDGAVLPLLRDPHAAAQAGGLAHGQESAYLPRILHVPDRRDRAERVACARGPHAVTVWAISRISRD